MKILTKLRMRIGLLLLKFGCAIIPSTEPYKLAVHMAKNRPDELVKFAASQLPRKMRREVQRDVRKTEKRASRFLSWKFAAAFRRAVASK